MKGKKTDERPVLVTTEWRGVFFGYASAASANGVIALRAARNCIYWGSDVKGVFGLAATGPTSSCRVGPAVDLDLRGVTSIADVTPAAAKAWEEAPWA